MVRFAHTPPPGSHSVHHRRHTSGSALTAEHAQSLLSALVFSSFRLCRLSLWLPRALITHSPHQASILRRTQ